MSQGADSEQQKASATACVLGDLAVPWTVEQPLESHDAHNPSFTTHNAFLEFGEWAISVAISRYHRQAALRNWPFLARPGAGL